MNTSDFWLATTGWWSDIILLLYFLSFLVAIGFLVHDIIICIKGKLKDKKQIIITLAMLIIVVFPFLFPGGLLPKKLLYNDIVLVAFLDGVAGNNGWLTLYGNNNYEYSYSSNIYLNGKYKLKNDTIFFDSPRNEDTYEFDYATFGKDKSHIAFKKDSIAYFYMEVFKNDLIK